VRMKLGHHAADIETARRSECLNLVQNLLGPFQVRIIGYDYHTLTAVPRRFHSPLNEEIHASPVVTRPPWRISIEALEKLVLRQALDTIVENSLQILKAFAICEPIYCANHALVKIEYSCHAWSVVQYAAGMEVGNTDTYRVAVTNEGEPLLISPAGDK